ncbi:MAG TPA: DUF167 domain-containing protein [Candidatus Limnocylindria bacterium]|nr:DUF167 domain-containing protein [Candidatus Limnocylindria bacterium]
MLAVRRTGDRIHFGIRVTPRAAHSAVTGEREGLLLVRVTAAPTGGEANAAVVAILARVLDIAPSSVRIERGAGARTKQVSVPASVHARLAALIG